VVLESFLSFLPLLVPEEVGSCTVLCICSLLAPLMSYIVCAVYAVEASSLADWTELLVAANNKQDVIQVLRVQHFTHSSLVHLITTITNLQYKFAVPVHRCFNDLITFCTGPH
jgi:hypothetical protein